MNSPVKQVGLNLSFVSPKPLIAEGGNVVQFPDRFEDRDKDNPNRIKPSEPGGRMSPKAEKVIVDLRANFEKHAARADELADRVQATIDEFKRAALPPKPEREYEPREDIIEYIQSADGFGPWVEAKALTRPLMRDLSPKAYMALANWLRKNTLPEGLEIPTKKEIIDARLSDPEFVAQAQRVNSNLYYRRRVNG